jgi:hypothetical protein
MGIPNNTSLRAKFVDDFSNPVAGVGIDGTVYTPQIAFADGTSQDTAGGGGSGVFQSITVTIPAASIPELSSTPFLLLSGTPGQFINVFLFAFNYIFGTTPYTVAGDAPTFEINCGVTNDFNYASINAVGVLDQTSSQIACSSAQSDFSVDSVVGQGVYASFVDSTISGGDGDIVLTLYYTEVPVL